MNGHPAGLCVQRLFAETVVEIDRIRLYHAIQNSTLAQKKDSVHDYNRNNSLIRARKEFEM